MGVVVPLITAPLVIACSNSCSYSDNALGWIIIAFIAVLVWANKK